MEKQSYPYALHFIDCNLSVKYVKQLFINRALWIKGQLNPRSRRKVDRYGGACPHFLQPPPPRMVSSFTRCGPMGSDRHEGMLKRTRLCNTLTSFEAKGAAVAMDLFQMAVTSQDKQPSLGPAGDPPTGCMHAHARNVTLFRAAGSGIWRVSLPRIILAPDNNRDSYYQRAQRGG